LFFSAALSDVLAEEHVHKLFVSPLNTWGIPRAPVGNHGDAFPERMICFVLPPEDKSTSEKAEQCQDHHDDKNGLERHISPPPSRVIESRSPGATLLRSSPPLSVHAAAPTSPFRYERWMHGLTSLPRRIIKRPAG
jgi:hypothetical protein